MALFHELEHTTGPSHRITCFSSNDSFAYRGKTQDLVAFQPATGPLGAMDRLQPHEQSAARTSMAAAIMMFLHPCGCSERPRPAARC